MTQKMLADRAGVTQGFISQVENNLLDINRRSTLIAIATALDVTVAQLLGIPGDPTDAAAARAAASVPQLRAAITQLEFGDFTGAERVSVDQMRRRIDEVHGYRLTCEFDRSAPLFPQLLRDVAHHSPALKAEVLHAASSLLRSINYRDLAWRAADVAMTNARQAEDPGLIGVVEFGRLKCMPSETPSLVAAQAARVCDELQRHPSNMDARRGYGSLHLSLALAAATLLADQRDVEAHLDEAASVARSVGEPPTAGGLSMGFGPTNVKLWRMAAALEAGQPHKVIDIARTFEPTVLPDANRISTYWLDYGRAVAALGGRDEEAIGYLARAEDAAPQYMRILPAARNTVKSMIVRAQKRAVADNLRRLADKMGL
jgi:transcriptional regulator with XRE-family HTH domain